MNINKNIHILDSEQVTHIGMNCQQLPLVWDMLVQISRRLGTYDHRTHLYGAGALLDLKFCFGPSFPRMLRSFITPSPTLYMQLSEDLGVSVTLCYIT